jgi:hypothetical protein
MENDEDNDDTDINIMSSANLIIKRMKIHKDGIENVESKEGYPFEPKMFPMEAFRTIGELYIKFVSAQSNNILFFCFSNPSTDRSFFGGFKT